MRQELEALKAAEAEAKAAERARAQRIDALANSWRGPAAKLSLRRLRPPRSRTPPLPAAPAKEVRASKSTGSPRPTTFRTSTGSIPTGKRPCRPSKIPTTDDQFGDDGQSIFSVRQSRFGVQARQEIGGKDLFVKFEFDLFGTGDDAGQTTFRLRHAYGSWGPILAGQTNSLFMDGDTFPNTVDYWGPVGMVFLRNPQIRYTYATGAHKFAVAIEKPSNDIDAGNIRQLDPNSRREHPGQREAARSHRALPV